MFTHISLISNIIVNNAFIFYIESTISPLIMSSFNSWKGFVLFVRKCTTWNSPCQLLKYIHMFMEHILFVTSIVFSIITLLLNEK